MLRSVWQGGKALALLPSSGPGGGRQFRLGLVGLGQMGMLHWQTWQRFANASVVAVVDTDPAKAQWARAQGVPFFHQSADLPGHLDAVIIASPVGQHASCALPLLTAGIHCLIEKPIALSLCDAQQLLTVANRHGALLTVGHSERFNPALQQLRDAVASPPRFSLEVFRMAAPTTRRDPLADVVQDLMVHDLDWMLDLMGQMPCHLRVQDARWVNGSLACVSCELSFAPDVTVVLTSSYMATTRRREVILRGANGATQSICLDSAITGTADDPLTGQARAFLAALQGKPSAIATGDQALGVLTLVEQIRAQCTASHAIAH